MTRLKLTSPGALLIVATVLAGGILLLDGSYLSPHVEAQKNAALREQAVRIEQAGRYAIEGELHALGTAAAGFARTQAIRGFLSSPTPSGQPFRSFARRTFHGTGVGAAWITRPGGDVLDAWSDSPSAAGASRRRTQQDIASEAIKEIGFRGVGTDRGLVRVPGGIVLFARREVHGAGGGQDVIGHLWLVRGFDAALRRELSGRIGGELQIVSVEAFPASAHAGGTSQGLWVAAGDRLLVAWLADDPAGHTLGYFRADLPVTQIHGQAIAARRMILIVLSLSVGLVVLVITGIHILITGPVFRLLRRLQQMDAGDGSLDTLTNDLHGEPLILARRLESAFEKLSQISKTDELTGLANRRQFEEVLECFYHQSRRYSRPMSLIAMDVDFFKAVNDAAGHQAGDLLLKKVASHIEEICRKADLPARLGGDEFAVLLPETPAADARKVAERILCDVRQDPFISGDLELSVTLSIGVTDLNAGDIDSRDAMMATADRALYAAKELGRNRVVMAHDLNGVGLSGEDGSGETVDVLCKKLAGLDSQFKGLFLQAVEEVVKILEQRDPNMADHARKVQRYAVLIAEEMELPERVVQRIEIAAMLHDIGMMALPDSVLLCPSELTPEQLSTMRRHSLLGVRIMERMEFLDQEIPAVRYHHERYDGKGYPEGIDGSQIPLTARILAVADVFDALTSSRTFRGPCPTAEAIQEIRHAAGSQFDPAVVNAFLAVAQRLEDRLVQGGRKTDSRWRQTIVEEALESVAEES